MHPGRTTRTSTVSRTMILKKLRTYLDTNDVQYIVISHPEAFTSQEIAHLVHIPGKEVAKTVMINVEGANAMAVLPASHNIDFTLLSTELGSVNIYLESEEEFQNLFPNCELGAMPPFGNLYDMPVFVAESLTEDDQIVFNAGTHRDLVRMSYSDFAKLVQPKILPFSVPREANPGHVVHN